MPLLCLILELYLLVMLAAVVMSWLRPQPGSGLASVQRVLWQLTEPVLGPIRRVLPGVRVGAGMVDFSPLVAFFVIVILQSIVCR
jgi:YggT family protein